MGVRSKAWLFLPVVVFFFTFKTTLSLEADTISAGQSLSGNQTITSKGGNFELGFFTPNKSPKYYYYIGIWYKRIPVQTVVWVANRYDPLLDPYSSELKFSEDGNLALFDSSKTVIWSTDYLTSNTYNSTRAVLLESGNLVIQKGLSNFSSVIWQSFNNPTDTWLPSGKIGLFSELTSWRNSEDPQQGTASVRLEVDSSSNLPREWQLIYNKDGWSNNFDYEMEMNCNNCSYSFVSNMDETYLTYFLHDTSIISRFVIDYSGQMKQVLWLEDIQEWVVLEHFKPVRLVCAMGNNPCGEHAICNWGGIPLCECLPGYEPKLLTDWNSGNWSGGCVSKTPFLQDSIGGKNVSRGKMGKIVWGTVGAFVGIVTLLGIVLLVIWQCRRRRFISVLKAVEDSLVLFRYRDLRSSTKNFSEKLGRGGFGSVFKGTLPNSTVIAVKKLEYFMQGEKQFRAEVTTIGTIQHINLVRLRGFCAEGSKRFLVYEYMPNGSLDSHLFQKGSKILDWKARYQIALGTARGLAYLHEECRDCIVHCDIKPGNILLDAGFNAKVADFGLAKFIGRDLSRVLTTMRGTRGYLAPEWISGAAITAKADVYSYGMMLFEVISGRRNLEVSEDEVVDFFPTKAVNIMNKGEEVVSLLDYRLEGNADIEELTRACKVACWCIQDDEKDRPSMKYVVQILDGVLHVGVPPIPKFLQTIVYNGEEENVFEESSSDESSQAFGIASSFHLS